MYAGNTWRPTSAILRVEDTQHPATVGLPITFKSAPNEWYKWANDLRTNRNIKILAAIDPASFPWAPGRSRTKSGTTVTTPWSGQTRNTA